MWHTEGVLDVLVRSPGHQFDGKTELEVLDGANLLLVGQEIVRFVEAAQFGALEWRLSKLLRGRRDTESAMATHQVGESVLVLDPATFSRAPSLDEVGLARFSRAVSIGGDPSLPEAVAFTNEAASLKPHAPVHTRSTSSMVPEPSGLLPGSSANEVETAEGSHHLRRGRALHAGAADHVEGEPRHRGHLPLGLVEQRRLALGKLWGRHANVDSPSSGSGPTITAGWHTLVRVWDGRQVRQYFGGLRTNAGGRLPASVLPHR